ncbi:hypothetical protein GCM10023155_36700 [Bremerella cremea]
MNRLDCSDPGAIGQIEIEQHNIDFPLPQMRQTILESLDMGERELFFRLVEKPLDLTSFVGRIFNQKDPYRWGHKPIRPSLGRGASQEAA